MHTDSIPADSTIVTIWNRLTHADDFASGVLSSMHALRSRGEDVVVRLGITGAGKQPNYRVEDAKGEHASVAYDGATHRPFPEHEQLETRKTWSSEVMTYLAVAEHRRAVR